MLSDVRFWTLNLAVGRRCGAERRPISGKIGFADGGFCAARGLAVSRVGFAACRAVG